MDAEKPANKPWAEKYKVEAYPTTAFIDASGKTLLQNMGMLRAPELMEAARTAMGEMVNFEQLYDNYKKDPKNLATAQQLLLKAPSFLAAQDGIEAEKWVTRIGKIYKDYLKEKWGDALINKKDYVIINALGVPFPPALLGMLILTALLCGNVIPASSIEGICDILISKMGMLFLPAGVSVILYADVIKAELLPITVTIVVCSIVVLSVTAFFIEAMLKGKESQ